MSWVPPAPTSPETYRIEAGATDLRLSHGKPITYYGFFQATLDLTRTALYLRSLRLTSREHGHPDRTFDITADLENFAKPRWHAKLQGDFDLRLFDPLLDFPNVPAGLARPERRCRGRYRRVSCRWRRPCRGRRIGIPRHRAPGPARRHTRSHRPQTDDFHFGRCALPSGRRR